MAVYSVTSIQRLDDYAVVQTLVETPIEVGQTITLASLGNGLDGAHTVLACPAYAFIGTNGDTGALEFNAEYPRQNQLLFYDAGDDIDWNVLTTLGTCTWTQTCTWITAANIDDYLGIPLVDAGTTAFLAQCASAANSFAYRRRVEAGYLEDSLTTSPGGDVTLGTIMIGAAYYRQRSSYNTIASFDGMGAPPASGVTPMIMQLLGINRPQVA